MRTASVAAVEERPVEAMPSEEHVVERVFPSVAVDSDSTDRRQAATLELDECLDSTECSDEDCAMVNRLSGLGHSRRFLDFMGRP